VIDDFLAPVVFDVEVDVGGLGPFFRKKAFEEEVDLDGVDRSLVSKARLVPYTRTP